MDPASFLSTASDDGRALLAAAEAGWDRPVPHCPDWDTADLVRHTGGIFEWMAAVVGSSGRVSRRALDPAPEDPAELPRWYSAALDRVVDTLGDAESG